jgi:hypothetical protein
MISNALIHRAVLCGMIPPASWLSTKNLSGSYHTSAVALAVSDCWAGVNTVCHAVRRSGWMFLDGRCFANVVCPTISTIHV